MTFPLRFPAKNPDQIALSAFRYAATASAARKASVLGSWGEVFVAAGGRENRYDPDHLI